MKILGKLVFNNEILGVRVKNKGILYDFDLSYSRSLLRCLCFSFEDISDCIYLREHLDTLMSDEEYWNGTEVCTIDSKLAYDKFRRETNLDSMKVDYDLKHRFNYYNKLLFYNKIADDTQIYWSNKMTSIGGNCTTSRIGNPPIIKISRKYIERYPDALDSTILHEMIHAYLPAGSGHGYLFKNEVDRLGSLGYKIDLHTRGNYTDFKYVLQCRDCNQIYLRKRFNLSELPDCYCGVCRGSLRLVNEDLNSVGSVFKCKKCNGAIAVEGNINHTICIYCGSVEVKKIL